MLKRYLTNVLKSKQHLGPIDLEFFTKADLQLLIDKYDETNEEHHEELKVIKTLLDNKVGRIDIDIFTKSRLLDFLHCENLITFFNTDKNRIVEVQCPNEAAINFIDDTVLHVIESKIWKYMKQNRYRSAHKLLESPDKIINFFENFIEDCFFTYSKDIYEAVNCEDMVRHLLVTYFESIASRITSSDIKVVRNNQAVSEYNLYRPDIVVKISHKLAFIIELKYNKYDYEKHTAEEALTQIRKDHHDDKKEIKYHKDNWNLYYVGVVFQKLGLVDIKCVNCNPCSPFCKAKDYKRKK
jgi:hypothetical protein